MCSARFGVLAAAQAVHGVRQAVQVEAAGDPDGEADQQGRGRRVRQRFQQDGPGPQKDQSQDGPHPGEPEQGAGQVLRPGHHWPEPGDFG